MKTLILVLSLALLNSMQPVSAENLVGFDLKAGELNLKFKIHGQKDLSKCYLLKVRDGEVDGVLFAEGIDEKLLKIKKQPGLIKAISESMDRPANFYLLVFPGDGFVSTSIFYMEGRDVTIIEEVKEGVSVTARIKEDVFVDWFRDQLK